MGIVLTLAILAALMLLPLRLTLQLSHAARTQGILGVAAGPIRFSFPFRVERDAKGGHQLIFLPRRQKKQPRPASPANMRQGMAMLGACLRADKARRFLLRHTHLIDLTVQAHLSLSDAASTAVITGLLRALTAFLPAAMRKKTHLSLQPDFLTLRSSGYVRCIVSLRLGILLITGGMTLTAWLLEKREHTPSSKEASIWNIRSAR